MSFKPSSSVETFLLFYNSKLILILGLVTLLYPLNGQIIDYIQAIENEFDAYNSQLKAKIQFQEEFLEYEDLLDRLITENTQIP
jgi:hypothetical protein